MSEIQLRHFKTFGRNKRHKSRSDQQKTRRAVRRRWKFLSAANNTRWMGHSLKLVSVEVVSVSKYTGYYTCRYIAESA